MGPLALIARADEVSRKFLTHVTAPAQVSYWHIHDLWRRLNEGRLRQL